VQRPGANGLKVRDGVLYVSNSSRGEIYRLRLSGVRPAGQLKLAYSPGPVDDFAFLADGSIVGTTHGDKLIRIARDGTVSDLMSEGCDGCTSVAEYGPDRDLIVLTTGSLLEGGGKLARLLRLQSPIARRR
jgi:sugar lactone lactonase YvrE